MNGSSHAKVHNTLYRDHMQVEALFRTAKALMHTRPIYHDSDAAIRGHVFCSLLALVLRKELDERCRNAGSRPELGDVLRDLDRLQEVEICKEGQQITLRTPATGVIGPLFKAARVALPPNVRETAEA
jgi:transposase